MASENTGKRSVGNNAGSDESSLLCNIVSPKSVPLWPLRRCHLGWMHFIWLLLGLSITFSSSQVTGQSFSEWFKQKKTQKKYLKAQIAALGIYMRAVEKGYGIAKQGLTTIEAFREGDFLQHRLHFSNMEMVSPGMQQYAKVRAIPEMAAQSKRQGRHIMATAENNVSVGRGSDPSVRLLRERELTALRQMTDEAASQADKDIKTLELLVSDHQLKLTEDERIFHIDQLYMAVKKKLSAILRLERNLQALLNSRRQAAASARLLKRLCGGEPP